MPRDIFEFFRDIMKMNLEKNLAKTKSLPRQTTDIHRILRAKKLQQTYILRCSWEKYTNLSLMNPKISCLLFSGIQILLLHQLTMKLLIICSNISFLGIYSAHVTPNHVKSI